MQVSKKPSERNHKYTFPINFVIAGSLKPDPEKHSASMTYQLNVSIPVEVRMRLQIMMQVSLNLSLYKFALMYNQGCRGFGLEIKFDKVVLKLVNQ